MKNENEKIVPMPQPVDLNETETEPIEEKPDTRITMLQIPGDTEFVAVLTEDSLRFIKGTPAFEDVMGLLMKTSFAVIGTAINDMLEKLPNEEAEEKIRNLYTEVNENLGLLLTACFPAIVAEENSKEMTTEEETLLKAAAIIKENEEREAKLQVTIEELE